MKNLSWRIWVVPVVLIVAIVYILPTIDMELNHKKDPTLWPNKKINLGLDLQGGMHLVLEVETDKAVEGHMEHSAQELKRMLRIKHVKHGEISIKNGSTIQLDINNESLNNFNEILDKDFKELKVSSTTNEGQTAFVLNLPAKDVAFMKKMAGEQALETIRNRIDEFGVNEPDIRSQGENQILIELPGVTDTKRAKELIGKTALLQFKLVDENHDVEDALKGNVPPGSEILYEVKVDRQTNRSSRIPLLIKKRTALTGAHLTDARVQINSQYNEPNVAITFDQKGARQFARITGENVNKRLAIVLDNTVYSAPNIKSRIAGGSAIIEGSFSTQEAHDLAIVLRAGALPAPVKIIEERTVGPSLGQDSISKGLMSMYIGGLIVVLFMMIYYKVSGIIADIALFLNIILIAGGLAAFQATLTLPGIAGIILTIGMAVDSNVLIFERIREETFIGKTPRAAVAAGFDRATLTILDANVTTLIAALVLFQFGSGPVKGFAVTLSLGVISSLFTALIVSRLIFDYLLINKKLKTLSI